MCGIFALLNNDTKFSKGFIEEQFKKGSKRGPEFSILDKVTMKTLFGFHRLAINGLNSESNQPLFLNDIAIICNGEIYNYKELYQLMEVTPNTDSDCEVILHLYQKYGVEQTLQMLDGVFSFILVDFSLYNEKSKIYVARDPYGVRPLYYLKPIADKVISTGTNSNSEIIHGFASEMKVLNAFFQSMPLEKNSYTIEHFEPGSFSVYELGQTVNASWKPIIQNQRYHSSGFKSTFDLYDYNLRTTLLGIQTNLIAAVHKRCSTTERPIACLLSGGLDSSVISALVNDYHKIHNLPTIETYSIGLAGSEDLKYAAIVAEYLGTKHHEVILTEQDFLDAIPAVIESIESYDTTTVRASIGNWLLGKYISEHSDAKVIFNGDGSDELMGGYLYMHKTPDSIEFDKECRRLLKDIHAFDVLRSDKSISSHGLEPRTPFLDRQWTQYYLSIPYERRNHAYDYNKKCEKYLLRLAFSQEYFENRGGLPILPDEILWRKKEAFSDGVSKTTRSLYEIIQEYTEELFVKNDCNQYKLSTNSKAVIENLAKTSFSLHDHLVPATPEQYYYRKVFESVYPGLGKIVPYFWMPKYVNASDASARTLSLYNDEIL
jgi:asparagine synthase (glutamine-hydrolysing)